MNYSRWLKLENLIFIFVLIFINTLSAMAGPGRTTYQAKIIKPDGTPLEAANVNFKFTILDPVGNCILYSETYSSVNMANSGGLTSFALGTGIKTYPVSATTFENVFSNTTPALSCDAGGPPSYSPLAEDTRKIVMQFHDGNGWQTLPAMAINAVPYAMYANDSLKLNGKADTDYVEVSTLPMTCGVSEALRFNGAAFSCIAVGGAGGGAVTSGSVILALGYTPADGANVSAVSSTVAGLSAATGSLSSSVSTLASGLFSVSTTVTGLSTSVTSLTTVVADHAVSLTALANDFATVSATANSALTAANSAQTTANAVSSSVAGFSSSVSNLSSSMAAITSSQWVTSGSMISYNLGSVSVSGVMRIGIDATSCAPGAAGALRYNAGLVEYCNGAIWSAFGVAGAGITNVNGSTSATQLFNIGIAGIAPSVGTFNGVHTFNMPYAASAGVAAGLLSYADYTAFTNKADAVSVTTLSSNIAAVSSVVASKITSSAASVAQVLGYTPANAVSVTTLSSSVAAVSSAVASLANSGKSYYTDSYNVPPATYVPINLNAASSTMQNGQAYRVELITVATGTNTGAVYIVYQTNVGTWAVNQVSANGNASNHPLLRVNGANLEIYHGHAATYGINTFVTTVNSGNSTIQAPTLFGLESAISVFGSNVGIGTSAPTAALQVVGNIVSSKFGVDGGFAGTRANGTQTAPTQVLANDRINYLIGSAYYTGGSSGYANTTGISMWAAQNQTDVGRGSYMTFETTASGAITRAERMRIDPSGNVSIGVGSPVTRLDVSGAIRIGMEAATCAPSYAGTIRYNAGVVEFCNGTTWSPFGVAGAGITNLNGSTSGAQTFATGIAGTQPAFVTLNGVHTLNIPRAASSSVAAGLISNADYVSFVNQGTSITTLSSNKITSSAASIAQTLGYVPAASGAPLTLDEVTSALGYTPASASASSKWTASGTAIHYLGGNVGIGTSSPNRRFEVWSGSGLAAFNGSVSNHGYLELYTDMNNPTARTAYMGFPTSGSKTLAIYSQIASGSVQLQNVNGVLHMAHNGLVGVGSTNPTARLHIISGTATAASLKFDQSTLLASPQAGAVEYDGTSLYYTDNTNTRRMLASSSGTVDASNLNSAGNITMTPTGSVIVSSTTASTNSQTGALIVKGGVGITGNLFSSGTIITSNNIQGLVVTATSGIISPLVAGSSLASGNLQLESTLNATKGNILINALGGRVGIGTASPQAILHVSGTVGSQSSMILENRENSLIPHYLDFKRSRSGASVTPGDFTGGVRFLGYNGTFDQETATILSRIDSISPQRGSLLLQTNKAGTMDTRMLITADGHIGIGTTAPAANLSIESPSVPSIQIKKTGAGAADTFNMVNDMDANGNFWFAKGSVSGVPTSANRLMRVNNEGNLEIYGQAANATDNSGVLGLKTQASGDGGTRNEVSLEFYADRTDLNTMSGFFGYESNTTFDMTLMNSKTGKLILGTSNTTAMTITSSGAVAIGTNSPQGKVDIAWGGASGFVGGADMAASTRTTNTNKWFRYAQVPYNNSNAPFLAIMTGATSTENGVYIGGGSAVQPTATAIRMYTGTSQSADGSAVERMTILPSGNVGIGAVNPTAKLEVSGTSGLTLKIVDGNQGAGKVLTSDANGVASWQGAGAAWGVVGNAGTSATANFIGTTDNVDLVFRRNNLRAGALGQTFTSFGRGAYVATSATGSFNAAFGTDALANNSTGYQNTAMGNTALQMSTTGYSNSGFGDGALKATNTGNSNTGMGQSALTSNTNGSGNSAFGTNALVFSLTGSNNTALGKDALYNNTTGIMNTAIGLGAGSHPSVLLQSISNSVFVGASATATANGLTNVVAIGYQAQATKSHQVVLGNPSITETLLRGNVGIGTVSATYKLTVSGGASLIAGNGSEFWTERVDSDFDFRQANDSTKRMISVHPGQSTIDVMTVYGNQAGVYNMAFRIHNTNNYIGLGMSGGTYPVEASGTVNIASNGVLRFGGTQICSSAGCTAVSDERLKENIQPLDFSVEKLLTLRPVQYDWINKEKFGSQHEIGFIAQELEKYFPNVVHTDTLTGYKSVSYDKLMAPVIQTLQIFNKRIAELFDRSEKQQRQIASVKEENAKLKARVEKTEKENEELKKRLERIEKALSK